jgi:hypothetical protein
LIEVCGLAPVPPVALMLQQIRDDVRGGKRDAIERPVLRGREARRRARRVVLDPPVEQKLDPRHADLPGSAFELDAEAAGNARRLPVADR